MRPSLSPFTTTIAVALLVAACTSSTSPAAVATPLASGPPGSTSATAPVDSPASTASPSPSRASGSTSPAASPWTSPSVFDGSWLPAGELLLGRSQTHVALVGVDEVMVVGSDNICSPGDAWDESVAAEVGDPLEQVWMEAASLPSPRDRFAIAALPNGRALVTGGTTSQGGEIGPRSYSSTYLFDPNARSWSRSGLLNTARSDPAAAVLADGRVLVAGGYYADLPANPPFRMLDSSELFEHATGTWSRTGSLLEARYGASAVTLADGRVLIVGGWPSVEYGPAPLYGPHQLPLTSAEVYDPETGRWNEAGDLDLARTDFVLVALADGGALVAGGTVGLEADASRFVGEPTSRTERFDPNTSTWSPTGDMTIAAADRTGVRLADGQVLVAGGDLTVHEADVDFPLTGLTADAELYDLAAGIWKATTPMPQSRSGASAIVLEDGSVLLVGGIKAHASPGDTPACPVPDRQALRYVPGS